MYHTVLLDLSDNFKVKLMAGYQNDTHYKPIIDQLRANAEKEDEANLPYELGPDDLLYSVNHDIYIAVRRT
jgi:hypothetical protein